MLMLIIITEMASVEKMKLTATMFQELNVIRVRYQVLLLEAYSNFPDSFNHVEALHHEELNAYKVKLENFVSETDVKEQLNSYSTQSLKLRLSIVCFQLYLDRAK